MLYRHVAFAIFLVLSLAIFLPIYLIWKPEGENFQIATSFLVCDFIILLTWTTCLCYEPVKISRGYISAT